MKLTGPREDGDSTTYSPPMHVSEEDALIASTILNMAQTQMQILGKINEMQADQKTILEELRRDRAQSQMFIGVLQKCHEGELERLMRVMTLCCERSRVPEQQPAAVTTQAAYSNAFSGAMMGTMGGVSGVPRALVPSMTAYGAASTPNTFFGGIPTMDDTTHAQYVYLQQQIAAQQQQRMMTPQGGISGSSLNTMGYPSLGTANTSFASPSRPAGFNAAAPPPVAAYSSPQMIPAAQKVMAPPVQQQQQHVFGIAINRVPAQSPMVANTPNVIHSAPPPTLTSAFHSESKVEVKPTGALTSSGESPKGEAVTVLGSLAKQEPLKSTVGATTFSFSDASSTVATPPTGHTQTSTAITSTPLAVKPSGGFTFGLSTSQSPPTATMQKSSATVVKAEHPGREGEEEEVPEPFEPSAHFEPVIPLPDLVEVTTGEENEKVVFAERCKLYRFATESNEWKERGVGVLKILQDPNTGSYRIVMRREQIHKVCANHKIQAEMSLTPMQKSDRAYVWLALDFSEGEVTEEKLAARFKTVDMAKKFYEMFNVARDATAAAAASHMKSGGQATVTVKQEQKETKANEEKPTPRTDEIPKGFGNAFKPAVGSWECKTCYVRNNADVNVCPCCNTAKDGPTATAQSASVFASKPMSTVAPIKGESGRFSFGLGATSTASAIAATSPQSAVSTGSDKTPVAPTFGISFSPESNESAKATPPTSTVCAATVPTTTTQPVFGFAEKFRSGVPAVSSAPNFNLFAALSTTSAPVSLPKPTFSLGIQAAKGAFASSTVTSGSTAAPASTQPSALPSFSLAMHQSKPLTSTVTATITSTVGAAPTSTQSTTVPTFSFKFPTAGDAAKSSPTHSITSTTTSVFGGPAVFGTKTIVSLDKKGISGSSAEKPKASTFGGSAGTTLFGMSSSVFGGGLTGSGSGGFAALAAMAKADPTKEKKETTSTSSTTITPFGGGKFDNAGTSVFSTLASKKADEDSKGKSTEKTPSKGDHSEGEEEFVPTAHFEPVIPTPPIVQVKTGEEDEKVLFKARAKLYRFVDEAKEYKERGVGDIKILLNEKNGKCRIVMRRELVLKVCANTPLICGMTIKKKPGTENACMWICKDYAEGASGTKECFVAKFKEITLADEFISVFRDACDGKFANSSTTSDVQSSTPKSEEKSTVPSGRLHASGQGSATCQAAAALEMISGEDDGAGPMGKRGNETGDEEYDEDPYEELADFPAKMTITEGFASPLKPVKPVEVKGSYSIGMQHDVGSMKIDLLDEDGVVQLTHFVMSDTTATTIGPKSMKYLAIDEKSKNRQILVEFERAEDRDEALKHIAEGVQLAIVVGEEDNEGE